MLLTSESLFVIVVQKTVGETGSGLLGGDLLFEDRHGRLVPVHAGNLAPILMRSYVFVCPVLFPLCETCVSFLQAEHGQASSGVHLPERLQHVWHRNRPVVVPRPHKDVQTHKNGRLEDARDQPSSCKVRHVSFLYESVSSRNVRVCSGSPQDFTARLTEMCPRLPLNGRI